MEKPAPDATFDEVVEFTQEEAIELAELAWALTVITTGVIVSAEAAGVSRETLRARDYPSQRLNPPPVTLHAAGPRDTPRSSHQVC